MKNHAFKAMLLLLLFSSCIVQSPKYTTFNQVLALRLGMSKAEVEEVLCLQPYDIKSVADTCTTYIYIYRVTNRTTFSFYTKPLNGRPTIGKYVQLNVAFSKHDKVINIETCSTCPDNLVTKSEADLTKIGTFITVTFPVLLLYLGLKK